MRIYPIRAIRLTRIYRLHPVVKTVLLVLIVAGLLTLALVPAEVALPRLVGLAVAMFASGLLAAERTRVWTRAD